MYENREKYSSSNVFEIIVPKGKLQETLDRINKPTMTKEDIEECKRVAEMYKKPEKK